MNEPGKSDRSIVPEKSSNKAGQSAAEGVEGRDLAKGNLRQQNTFRTQGRADVHSALEQVRQAAAKDRKISSPRCSTTSISWKRCARPTFS